MAKAKKKSTTKPPPSLIVKAAKAAAAKAKEFKLDETSARKVAKKVADKTTKEIAKTTVDGYREVVRETMKQHAPRQLEIISRNDRRRNDGDSRRARVVRTDRRRTRSANRASRFENPKTTTRRRNRLLAPESETRSGQDFKARSREANPGVAGRTGESN